MPAGTPARHAKNPGSMPGRGAQHAHATRKGRARAAGCGAHVSPAATLHTWNRRAAPAAAGATGWPAPPTRNPAGVMSTACPCHHSMRGVHPLPPSPLAPSPSHPPRRPKWKGRGRMREVWAPGRVVPVTRCRKCCHQRLGRPGHIGVGAWGGRGRNAGRRSTARRREAGVPHALVLEGLGPAISCVAGQAGMPRMPEHQW